MVLPPAMTSQARSTWNGSPSSSASTLTVPAGTMPSTALCLAGSARSGQAVDHFVDGAVPTHGHDDVGPRAQPSGDGRGILGALSRVQLHLESASDQAALARPTRWPSAPALPAEGL